MSNFESLHPALQHHIVNSLGWRALRPFQDELIPRVLAGKHLIVLAPTAGGKTEAAFFPVASRMLTEGWSGLSVLYLCPIKALLNNLDTRLDRYCTLLGRRSALWHGDVTQAARKKIQREPPDCLLTTPESLEAMLVSRSVNAERLFSGVRAVVIDEVHAFAGDDRGWHLLAVLERLARISKFKMQRIGLSATVGNPDDLIDWLAGPGNQEGEVVKPTAASSGGEADVQVDFVGSLANAATVITRLHRGEKRLVFVDSRARAERLAAELRQNGVRTFVTHSSLSQDQRRQAEHAFAAVPNCVIVATSVLELGVDVGDLDRVVQIDAPATVSSMLQRMGRTGRRAGTERNFLFLATDDDSLVQAVGLAGLWESGYVEPVVPPALPMHVVAQQLMASILEHSGVVEGEWRAQMAASECFASAPPDWVDQLVESMVAGGVILRQDGLLSFGQRGEEAYGHKHFLELMSVFSSPPQFEVLHGRVQLGFVDQQTFHAKADGPRTLSLGGRAWRVTHVDWGRSRAYVEPAEGRARSSWRGGGSRCRSYALCQAIRTTLGSDTVSDRWSRRAADAMAEIRQEFCWVATDATTVTRGRDGQLEWWTFGGARANSSLIGALVREIHSEVKADDFCVTFEASVKSAEVERAVLALSTRDLVDFLPEVEPEAETALKFGELLPEGMPQQVIRARLQDPGAVARVLAEPVRFVNAGPSEE